MQTVIGYDNPSPGSLKEFGILYNELPMIDGKVDMAGIKNVITPKTKMVEIQRSRGYSMRSPLSIADIEAITAEVHRLKPDCICFVDNCYGEFVDYREPTQVGADIMAGSLIKNPGGGIAPTGGYIAGKSDLVELASYRLTAPGMGDELGASLANNRLMFQGFFLAPHVVSQASKARSSRPACSPSSATRPCRCDRCARRHHPGHRTRLGGKTHCVLRRHPEVFAGRFLCGTGAWDMPGYADKIIMPPAPSCRVRPSSSVPTARCGRRTTSTLQGGLTFEHAVIGILGAAQAVLDCESGQQA